jgi:hypothetical protein
MPGYHSNPRLFLCLCTTVRCRGRDAWSEARARLIKGTWISKSLYFRHRKLDQLFSEFPEHVEDDLEEEVGAAPETKDGSPDVSLDEISLKTVALEETAHDLRHISSFVHQCILSFTASAPLHFADPPNRDSPTCIPRMAVYGPIENTGPHRLIKSAPENWTLLNHEERMLRSQICLQAMDVDVAFESFYANLLQHVREEIRRIEDIKASEWNRQVVFAKEGGVLSNFLSSMSVSSHPIHFQSGMSELYHYLTTEFIGICR